jgi:hypothetical protein
VWSFVLLYLACSVSYAFSRLDNSSFARQYQVALTLLPVPCLATMLYSKARKPLLCLMAALVLVAACNLRLPEYFPLTERRYLPAALQAGSEYGVPAAGTGRFAAKALQEEGAVKAALDRVLEPGETFLDLTMEGQHYFTAERRLLTEYPVYYTYPGDLPQKRALELLESQKVATALLDSSMVYDDSPLNLRAYYLYRYALLRGLPWEISPDKTLVMPAGHFTRAGLVPPDRATALRLLDKQFPDVNLQRLPEVWGRGGKKWKQQFPELLPLIPVRDAGPAKFHELRPGRVFEGRAGGLLFLEIAHSSAQALPLRISWKTGNGPDQGGQMFFKAGTGMHIVPLDASPRWLLAAEILSLTIEAQDEEPFSVREAVLHSR